MDKPIYLDYAATTPVDPRVVKKMMSCLTLEGDFGNPASTTHAYGWRAEELVEEARRQVARLVNASPREIIWTSGATESNNLALIGAARFYREKGRHIITLKSEHKAVLDTCHYLEKEGFSVTYLRPQPDGRIDLDEFASAIRPETILVSVMHVNNEIGVIQDIAAIGAITRSHGVLFHVDAAQSAGKLPIDLETLPVDLMSFSAHKLYGPKGIGALFVRRKPKVRLQALIHGGGHEQGLRSGTLATHQIVGMGEAYSLAAAEMAEEIPQIAALKQTLCQGLLALDGVQVNGHMTQSVAGIVNLSFAGVDGEALLMALTDIAVSLGSACNSANIEASHVLNAIGVQTRLAHSSIRFSLGRFTMRDEIEYAISHVKAEVSRLRQISPLWETVKTQ